MLSPVLAFFISFSLKLPVFQVFLDACKGKPDQTGYSTKDHQNKGEDAG